MLEVVGSLGLRPHREGGYFRETYRAGAVVSTEDGPRALSSAILYLLTAGAPSRFHRLRWDEIWFFHAGEQTELVLLGPEGSSEQRILGPTCAQVLVPGGCWQGARVAPGDGSAWTLASCVVSPGFEYEDFELADRESLLREFPQASEAILALT